MKVKHVAGYVAVILVSVGGNFGCGASMPSADQQAGVGADMSAQTLCVKLAKTIEEADHCTQVVVSTRPNLDGGKE